MDVDPLTPRAPADRRRAVLIASGAAVLAAVVAVAAVVVLGRDGGDDTVAPATSSPTSDTVAPTSEPATVASTAVPATEPAAVTTVAPTEPVAPTTAVSAVSTAPVATSTPLVETERPGAGVLWSTEFDTPGTALDNGMLLPTYGPHLTPRPGVVSDGALWRDPAMTEWEDVFVRAPVGPLEGDRYIEAVVTVASNGDDAHPALMFFDDPGVSDQGCAGGSTTDWADVDPWNNMQEGRISFVIDGCYDDTTHVFTGVMGEYRTYTVRAEIRGTTISMFLDGEEILSTTIPAGMTLPYAGLRLGQYGEDGGFDQYRFERFEVGVL